MSYSAAIRRIVSECTHESIKSYSINPGRDLLKCAPCRGQKGAYEFIEYMALAGEALLIHARDPYMDCDVAVKFPIPIFEATERTGKRAVHDNFWHEPEHSRLASFFNIKGSGDTASFNAEIQKKFLNGSQYQRMLHDFVVSNCKDLCYIPQVLEIQGGSEPCNVQQYVKAKSVMHWVQDKTIIEKLSLFKKMVKAIKIVFHDQFLMHSDIKPDNFLVTKDNLPVIIDLQHCKSIGDTGSLTHRDSISYSPYSSRRHVEDFIGRTDRDDIHSLCCTLWSMIKGYEPIIPGGLVCKKSGTVKRTWDFFKPSDMPEFLRDVFVRGTTHIEKDMYSNAAQLLEDIERITEEYHSKTQRDIRAVSTGETQKRELVVKREVLSADAQEVANYVINKKYKPAVIALVEFYNSISDM